MQLFSQNQISDRHDQRSSDLHDIGGGSIGIGNLHVVQETMQDSNFSPTTDQRMPKIDVDKID